MADHSQLPPEEPAAPERRTPWVLTDEQVQRGLMNWPLLRLLWGDPAFRYAFLACGVAGLLLLVGLPKIWIVTPRGFLPVIRISAVDMLEARIHGRIARTKDAQGLPQEAMYHWQVALANDPGSVPLIHGYLSNLLAQPPRNPERSKAAAQRCFWMIRIGGTNTADVGLALRSLEYFGYDELALFLVTNSPPPVPPAHQAAGLRSLLRLGRGEAYGVGRARLGQDPEVAAGLALFDAAWTLGWGGGPGTNEALATLRTAESDPAQTATSLKLQLLLAARQNDLERYGSVLARLRDRHADTPAQHAVHWELLRQHHRRAEAEQLALAFADPPVNPGEVMRVATVCLNLGLTNHASRYLEHFVPQLGATADTWCLLAGLLIDQGRWTDLRGLALEIRRHPLAQGSLAGYSFFLDGVAALGERARPEAMAAFARVPENPIADDAVAWRTAQELVRLEAAAPARDLLLPRTNTLGGSLEFWQLLVRAAYQERDSGLLLSAARHAHALASNRVDTLTDLSAALLIERADPEETLAVTRRLVQAVPNQVAARMNHALALLQVRQKAAARAILLTFEPARLSPVERTVWHFAEAQLLEQDGAAARALAAVEQVEPRFLFPQQLAQLNELRDRLLAQLGPEAGANSPGAAQ